MFNKNIINIEKNIQLKNTLSEHLCTKTTLKPNKPIQPKTLSYVLSKHYNNEYDKKLTETQKSLLKNTILMTEDSLTTEFNNISEITINRVNELLSETKDETLCATLVETKNKIRQLEPSKKTYIRVRGLLEDLN